MRTQASFVFLQILCLLAGTHAVAGYRSYRAHHDTSLELAQPHRAARNSISSSLSPQIPPCSLEHSSVGLCDAHGIRSVDQAAPLQLQRLSASTPFLDAREIRNADYGSSSSDAPSSPSSPSSPSNSSSTAMPPSASDSSSEHESPETEDQPDGSESHHSRREQPTPVSDGWNGRRFPRAAARRRLPPSTFQSPSNDKPAASPDTMDSTNSPSHEARDVETVGEDEHSHMAPRRMERRFALRAITPSGFTARQPLDAGHKSLTKDDSESNLNGAEGSEPDEPVHDDQEMDPNSEDAQRRTAFRFRRSL